MMMTWTKHEKEYDPILRIVSREAKVKIFTFWALALLIYTYIST